MIKSDSKYLNKNINNYIFDLSGHQLLEKYLINNFKISILVYGFDDLF